MAQFRLATAVTICGAVVMAYEVTGSRLLAPVVGTSVIAWTALIGVILGALSAGYWYGGRMADRLPRTSRLAGIIAVAALTVALTAVLAPVVTTAVAAASDSWGIRLSAVVSALLLFAPTAFLLGMVTPYATKLATADLAHNGATVGTLAALSTLGSIAGTFLAGFVLLGRFGSTASLAALAVVLVVSALLVTPRRKGALLCIIAVFVAIAVVRATPSPEDALRRDRQAVLDTAFQRVVVSDGTHFASGRPVRMLSTDPFGTQSSMYLDGTDPVAQYIRAFRWGEGHAGAPRNALLIGGAAYMWPREYLGRYPTARLTVVEIDEGVTQIARDYFGLRDDPRMTIVHDDGRRYLNATVGPFDVIYLDAFTSIIVPFQMVTREAVRRVDAALAPRGVVMANLIGSFGGEGSELIGSVARTYREVFPHVALVGLVSDNEAQVQNIMLMASREPLDEVLVSIGKAGSMTHNGMVLTDDFAPVERMASGLLRRLW
jgi:predicted membrane-bound spermidine synthase